MLRRDSDLEIKDVEKSNFELASRKTVDIKDPEKDTLRDLEMDILTEVICECVIFWKKSVKISCGYVIIKVLYL